MYTQPQRYLYIYSHPVLITILSNSEENSLAAVNVVQFGTYHVNLCVHVNSCSLFSTIATQVCEIHNMFVL